MRTADIPVGTFRLCSSTRIIYLSFDLQTPQENNINNSCIILLVFDRKV